MEEQIKIYKEAREKVVQFLKDDLLGPISENEIIAPDVRTYPRQTIYGFDQTIGPLERYSVGILYPMNSQKNDEEIQGDDRETDTGGTEGDLKKKNDSVKLNQTSMGFTFSVQNLHKGEIEIELTAGRYIKYKTKLFDTYEEEKFSLITPIFENFRKRKNPHKKIPDTYDPFKDPIITDTGLYIEEIEKLNKGSENSSSNNLEDEESETDKQRELYNEFWERIPMEDTLNLTLKNLKANSIQLFSVFESRGEIVIRTEILGDIITITTVLYNQIKDSNNKTESCIFQPKIKINLKDVEIAIINSDHTLDTFSLIYRENLNIGIGHGVAIDWEEEFIDGIKSVKSIWTEFLPTYEIERTGHSIDSSINIDLTMDFFVRNKNNPETIFENIENFISGYSSWIDSKKIDIDNGYETRNIYNIDEKIIIPDNLKKIAIKNLKNAENSKNRMNEGLQTLKSNPLALDAFILTNRAMRDSAKQSSKENITDDDFYSKWSWRPFQIGFLLQNITNIIDPFDKNRKIVDLLWFPTGGGKTEAYFGIASFILFYRRLRNPKNPDFGAGMGVLMRYTLRLLTIQQFQRATRLIMALEIIRSEDPKRLGKYPFSIGLWVGGDVTPNSRFEAFNQVTQLQKDFNVKFNKNGSIKQFIKCEWCHTKLTEEAYFMPNQDTQLIIKCVNKNCKFNNNSFPIPIKMVDEDIYDLPPSLIIATVDKFAAIPWRPQTSTLLGLSTSIKQLPLEVDQPDLIIQDELHLIEGPLGSLVSAYEMMILYLMQQKSPSYIDTDYIPLPKIIASTATAKDAESQIRGIYNRNYSIFTPMGLSYKDNYFSKTIPKNNELGRLYIGVHPIGHSQLKMWIRLMSNLQVSSFNLLQENEKDPFWTVLSYFNSIRELGVAQRRINDTDMDRIYTLFQRFFKKIDEPDIYRLVGTSDVLRFTGDQDAFDLPKEIARAEIPYETPKKGKFVKAHSVIVASNMIQVGIDITRLGSMLVAGQPKRTSEYIQATSRVGRGKSGGLVTQLYSWTRPRDRSHYEHFRPYHESIYNYVETVSVTPFASRAIEKWIHAIIIGVMRFKIPSLTKKSDAGKFKLNDPNQPEIMEELEEIKKFLLAKCREINPRMEETLISEFERVITSWHQFAGDMKGSLVYETLSEDKMSLMYVAGSKKHGELSFPTQWSLRDVEGHGYIKIR